MLLYAPTVCLQHRIPCSMYSQFTQLQGGFTQSIALWKHSCSDAVSCHTKSGLVAFSLQKNIRSAHLQNKACLFSSGQRLHCGLSQRDQYVKLHIPLQKKFSSNTWNSRNRSQNIGCTSAGLGLSFAIYGMTNSEGLVDNNINSTQTTEPCTSSIHGKEVYRDYSVTGIPGDGRCLFRSVAHGACIRSGKPISNEDLQRELADDLRTMVADEFIKRQAETEWFVEGDFDTYVSQIRKPHVWGGEPELFMASHVLQMPITVYMHDEEADGLIAIAEYGQEYGKEDPIQVLYHGFGHYDALHIPGKSSARSRL